MQSLPTLSLEIQQVNLPVVVCGVGKLLKTVVYADALHGTLRCGARSVLRRASIFLLKNQNVGRGTQKAPNG